MASFHQFNDNCINGSHGNMGSNGSMTTTIPIVHDCICDHNDNITCIQLVLPKVMLHLLAMAPAAEETTDAQASPVQLLWSTMKETH